MDSLPRIREALKRISGLGRDVSALADDDDLYDAGLSSHDALSLMVALEEAFDVEFPDRLLCRRTFMSLRAVAEALEEIGAQNPTGPWRAHAESQSVA
jgi:acyl carrier protein